MSIIQQPGPPPFVDIELATRDNEHIPNSQRRCMTPLYRTIDASMRDTYKHQAFRTPGPSAVYNCHGMTFASRRTTVLTPELARILEEDEYREVSKDDVLPGDVVLYFSADSPDIEHSGVVLHVEGGDLGQNIRVLSKWGHFSEVVHWLSRCPYDASQVRFYRIDE